MDFVNELRKRGKRITNAREVVCKILETSGHKHFTVEELHKLSLKKDKNIDLATVYRTLELLENINLIEHSHQVHGSGLYFVKDVHSNIHIVCESCGDISDLDIETSEKVNNLITSKTNFREITNHFVYSGICLFNRLRTFRSAKVARQWSVLLFGPQVAELFIDLVR